VHIVVCRKEGAVRALTKRELGEVELMLDVVWAGVLASDAIEHGGIPLNPVPARPDVAPSRPTRVLSVPIEKVTAPRA